MGWLPTRKTRDLTSTQPGGGGAPARAGTTAPRMPRCSMYRCRSAVPRGTSSVGVASCPGAAAGDDAPAAAAAGAAGGDVGTCWRDPVDRLGIEATCCARRKVAKAKGLPKEQKSIVQSINSRAIAMPSDCDTVAKTKSTCWCLRAAHPSQAPGPAGPPWPSINFVMLQERICIETRIKQLLEWSAEPGRSCRQRDKRQTRTRSAVRGYQKSCVRAGYLILG